MGKRKRGDVEQGDVQIARDKGALNGKEKEHVNSSPKLHGGISCQIIVGTYDKVVHGLTATISAKTLGGATTQPHIEFTETFLLHAHDAAVRCLALSPPKSKKILFASGSSDQEIQVYQLSTQFNPLLTTGDSSMSSSKSTNTALYLGNKSLGALGHHEGAINALCFPSPSKLLSAADDSTIAVTRTRDWTMLSVIKAPIPKAHGRPSGDTAPLGGTPAGVNDFAIHPSNKLMVSVGRAEKCMRLWNLVTGKKAGVLNFEKSVLQEVGEGKWASGEGRRVRWNSIGDEFVVAFERGCVVYGIDSQPKHRLLPKPSTKIHQIRYVPMQENETNANEFLALSTEDGRILFYPSGPSPAICEGDEKKSDVQLLQPIAFFGGPSDGLAIRIKDFEMLRLPDLSSLLIITCCSDGAIRIWLVEESELVENGNNRDGTTDQQLNGTSKKSSEPGQYAAPVGRLVGLYESKHRITCLAAFLMSEPLGGEESQSLNEGVSSAEENEKI